MTYYYCLWYSFEEWNDFPLIRGIEKFVHNFGIVQTFENKTMMIKFILKKFSNDK